MITNAACRLLAAYNTGMNRRLYTAAAALPDAERRTPRGAFFGSLHGTLCHLLWADRMWMSRFADWPKPPAGIPSSPTLIEDWAELQAARTTADAAIEAWAATLTPDWLAGELRWFSGAARRDMVLPRWIAVMHFFNHQTHHRGQAHCLITQQGVAPAATDLPWVVDLDALGLR